jgi:heme exporter protein A
MSLFLENLTIGRGGAALATDITFRVQPGSVAVLTGANGSGKTTLLRTIAGLLKPLAGAIAKPAALHWLGTDNALKADLTVRENLEFWGPLFKKKGILIALEKLNITPLADMPVRHLSAGQKRRVALSRLFLEARPLWLLDEPATGLDETSSSLLAGLVQEHAATGGIAVIATHEPGMWQAEQTLALS